MQNNATNGLRCNAPSTRSRASRPDHGRAWRRWPCWRSKPRPSLKAPRCTMPPIQLPPASSPVPGRAFERSPASHAPIEKSRTHSCFGTESPRLSAATADDRTLGMFRRGGADRVARWSRESRPAAYGDRVRIRAGAVAPAQFGSCASDARARATSRPLYPLRAGSCSGGNHASSSPSSPSAVAVPLTRPARKVTPTT